MNHRPYVYVCAMPTCVESCDEDTRQTLQRDGDYVFSCKLPYKSLSGRKMLPCSAANLIGDSQCRMVRGRLHSGCTVP